MRKQIWIPNPIRREVSLKSKGICYKCGVKATSATLDRWKIPKFFLNEIPFEIDHIIELSKGGETTVKNLAISCRSCNRKRDKIENSKAHELVEKINRGRISH